jgi:hypothetical protein
MTEGITKGIKDMTNKIGTKTYNLVFAICAIGVTTLLSIFGGVHLPALAALFVAMFNNVALYLLIISTFSYFFGGVQLKLNKKIFEEGNIAAAIYMGLIYLGIAILIGGAII